MIRQIHTHASRDARTGAFGGTLEFDTAGECETFKRDYMNKEFIGYHVKIGQTWNARQVVIWVMGSPARNLDLVLRELGLSEERAAAR